MNDAIYGAKLAILLSFLKDIFLLLIIFWTLCRLHRLEKKLKNDENETNTRINTGCKRLQQLEEKLKASEQSAKPL